MHNILDFPTELLLYIISFLNSCHIVKLRFVSKIFCVLTDVPLLWRKFEWPHFHKCEEISISNILKEHGIHIQQLSFTNDDHMPSKLYCDLMLRTCMNVINLTLLTQVPVTKCNFEKIL